MIRRDVQSPKLDTVVLKWMGGVLIAMVTAIVFELFLHVRVVSAPGEAARPWVGRAASPGAEPHGPVPAG